ncbi:Histone acetyltransferase HPA2 [Roseibacterium elongatum DSM 19469]|uniref:Histone acetyltransferase HPA2 n=1 Tax=Roseicyclus elongatus DSM 19469 TaxID=1294273 RepID=W8RQT6_9RHOB|nr:GNAT family N-acetyltransferase [Roseibacterium elongatum]AHM03524.1 Histone acetyltransferase HPA2 [Roseibacterium elongatum DSM 19469]
MPDDTLTIRCAPSDLSEGDKAALADLLLPVFRAGDTYTVDPDIDATGAVAVWTAPGKTVFLAEDAQARVLGTYYIRRNQDGGGAHVCNCGYVTSPAAQGKGIARAMLHHSIETARAMGYRAMQYNFVVSTNTRAIETWEKAGFQTVGRLPQAFHHPTAGYVDALVMMKDLRAEAG